MAAGISSGPLLEGFDRTLFAVVPIPAAPSDKLHKSIGVISHGTIAFPDNKSNRAKFIRVPPDAPVTRVKDLLNEWCNRRPPLVISITGGAKDYNMKPKLLRAFQRGLLKVARTTGAWIITGGMNTGVMKLVGDSLQINQDRSHPIHLIGIATWGCVSNHEQLEVRGTTVHYIKPGSEQKGEAPLQPNHTEFIFVDDGTERKYGGEIAFRARLEEAISGGFFGSKTMNSNNEQTTSLINSAAPKVVQSDPIPVVLIVVEGGPNTVRTIHEAVVQNSIPAVIIDGTGRCSNLFGKAYRLYDDYCEKFELTRELASTLDPATFLQRFEELKNRMKQDLAEELKGISGEGGGGKTPRKGAEKVKADRPARSADTTDYFELVYECIHTRQNFLNIVSLNSRNPIEPDIDLAILQALLKATSGCESGKTNIQQKQEQLRLALEWNRADIAKYYIMKGEREWEKIVSNEFFVTALYRNQLAFVKLFLDHDFSLSKLFEDTTMFRLLYQNVVREAHQLEKYDEPLRIVYQEKIQPLIGDFFDVDAVFKSQGQTQRSRLSRFVVDDGAVGCLTTCCCPTRSTAGGHRSSIRSDGSTGHSKNRLDVDKELFLWSVITGRRDFAIEFWSRGRNKICAALIATLIFKKLAHAENDNNYIQTALEYENLAVQILEKFHQTHTTLCSDAIIRRIPDYGDVTWLELAVAAQAKEFIAHRAVQDVLNNIWFGYIDQHVKDWRIIFSTVMLWYSGFLPYNIELVKPNETVNSLDHSFYQKYLLQGENSQNKSSLEREAEAIRLKVMDNTYDEQAETRFAPVGCWEKSVRKISQYFSNIVLFIRAPYVKYLYNLYFHVIFLLLFSYVMLCDFFPLYDFPVDMCSATADIIEGQQRSTGDSDGDASTPRSTTIRGNTTGGGTVSYGFKRQSLPSVTEFVLVIWIITLVIEEIRQLFTMEAQSKKNAIVAYFQVFWNKLDVLAIVLFFIGFSLRFINSGECFCAARIVLSVDLAIWFVRSLDIFAAVKRLGPKLVMISEMVHDLKFFMIMLTVFILAFGVSSYSLIYGVQEFSWHLPRRIINLAYWQIFGELNALETFEHNYQANGYTAFILLVAYMALVSILLVNLLIAMFSNTFDRLQTDTDRIWKFQRYSLVCEYLSRPSLPPPLILFSHIWRFALFLLSKCCKADCVREKYQQHQDRTKYKKTLDEKCMESIEISEDAIGDEVYYNYLKMGRKLIDDMVLDEEQIQSPQEIMLSRIRSLENRIQTMSSQQAHMFEYLECLMEGLKVMGGDRIRIPERRRFDPEESLINTQMSETSQMSTPSNATTSTTSTSETIGSAAPFTLKRWNLVGIWSWDVAHDVCAICRTALSESCLRCQAASNLQECIIVWGTCNHSFHNCCMSQWVKQRAQCPLCQTDWVINRIGQ